MWCVIYIGGKLQAGAIIMVEYKGINGQMNGKSF